MYKWFFFIFLFLWIVVAFFETNSCIYCLMKSIKVNQIRNNHLPFTFHLSCILDFFFWNRKHPKGKKNTVVWGGTCLTFHNFNCNQYNTRHNKHIHNICNFTVFLSFNEFEVFKVRAKNIIASFFFVDYFVLGFIGLCRSKNIIIITLNWLVSKQTKNLFHQVNNNNDDKNINGWSQQK